MITKNSNSPREALRVHWMTIVSILLCLVAFVGLLIMINPALFGYPFFLGTFPFWCFVLCPVLAIVFGLLTLSRPQRAYGKTLAKASILVSGLLLLTALILLYYATQFS